MKSVTNYTGVWTGDKTKHNITITFIPLSERRADSWQRADDMVWCWDAGDICNATVIAVGNVTVDAWVTQTRSCQLCIHSVDTGYFHRYTKLNHGAIAVRVVRSAVGKTVHFSQLQVQLGSGKSRKNWKNCGAQKVADDMRTYSSASIIECYSHLWKYE